MTIRPLDPAVIGEQCEHTEWVPEIESWVRCTANTLMHTPDTRVLCPEHCSCNEGASVDYPPLPDFLHAESEPVRYSKDEDGPQGEPNMNTLTIDGWSDDLIHVRGDDFAEEYTAGSDDAGWLQFACGAVVQVVFDDEGRWRTSVILPAPGLTIESYYRAPIIDPDDRDYSDRLTVSGDNLLPVRYFDDISHIDDLFNSVPQEWS